MILILAHSLHPSYKSIKVLSLEMYINVYHIGHILRNAVFHISELDICYMSFCWLRKRMAAHISLCRYEAFGIEVWHLESAICSNQYVNFGSTKFFKKELCFDTMKCFSYISFRYKLPMNSIYRGKI